jgi:hypothetical protein
MNDKRVLYSVGALLLLIIALQMWSGAEGPQYSDDPMVAELEKERDANIGKFESLPEEQRRAQGEQFREKMQTLSPEQQQTFFESSMPVWMPMMAKRFEEDYDKLVAMTPEEQRKELDRRIDGMEAGFRGGGPGGPGRGGRPPVSPEKMDEIGKKMLDWTTPDQRSKFENGMRMMNDRRKERGLAPMPQFGGGGF